MRKVNVQKSQKVESAVRSIFPGKYNPKPYPNPNTKPNSDPNTNPNTNLNTNPNGKVWDIDVQKVDLAEQLTYCKSTFKHSQPCRRFDVLGVNLARFDLAGVYQTAGSLEKYLTAVYLLKHSPNTGLISVIYILCFARNCTMMMFLGCW